MFHPGRQHQPPGTAGGRVAIGHSSLHRTGPRHLAGTGRRHGLPASLMQHLGLQFTEDEQDVARVDPGTVGRHVGREQHRRRHLVAVGGGVTQQDVPGHGMPEQGKATVAPRQCDRESGHLLQRTLQQDYPPFLIHQTGDEGLRVAAMPREVEGDRDVAVAGQGDRVGLHHLLGTGETVGDHHDRGGSGGGLAVDRHRDLADPLRLDTESDCRTGQVPPTGADGGQGDDGHDEGSDRHPAPCPVRHRTDVSRDPHGADPAAGASVRSMRTSLRRRKPGVKGSL